MTKSKVKRALWVVVGLALVGTPITAMSEETIDVCTIGSHIITYYGKAAGIGKNMDNCTAMATKVAKSQARTFSVSDRQEYYAHHLQICRQVVDGIRMGIGWEVQASVYKELCEDHRPTVFDRPLAFSIQLETEYENLKGAKK